MVQLRLQPGRFVWTISNASVSVHHHRTDENDEKEVSGSFEVAIDFLRLLPTTRLIYNANVDFVDLLFTFSSRKTGVNAGYNSSAITNGVPYKGRHNSGAVVEGVLYNGGRFSGVTVNGVPYNNVSINGMTIGGGGSAIVKNGAIINGVIYNSTNYKSAQRSDASKPSGSPPNAGPIQIHSRFTTPVTHSGIRKSIRSIEDDASISGINQPLTSSCGDAVLVSDGIGSEVVSSGDGASITSIGNKGSVNSTETNAKIKTNSSDVTIKSSGANASIHSSGNKVVINSSGPKAQIHSSGTKVVITSSGANAEISSSGEDSTIKSTGTNASISNSGTNTRIQSSGSAINDDLGQTIIRRLRCAIMGSWNSGLPEIVEGHQWTVRDGYVQGSGDPTGLIHGQEPQDYGRMITLLVSNDSIVDAFRSAFPNMPCCNLTQADLNGQPSGNNSPMNVSGKPSCLSDFFPDISTKYPGASVEVNLRGSQVPTASFSDENLKLTFPGSGVFRALLPDDSTVDCLTVDVTMKINVLLELNPGQLKGTVTSIISRSFTVVETTLGSVNQEVLKDAFDHISTVFLSKKFDEICQRGIPLPRPLLPGFVDYENVVMSTTEDGFLRMDADIKFSD